MTNMRALRSDYFRAWWAVMVMMIATWGLAKGFPASASVPRDGAEPAKGVQDAPQAPPRHPAGHAVTTSRLVLESPGGRHRAAFTVDDDGCVIVTIDGKVAGPLQFGRPAPAPAPEPGPTPEPPGKTLPAPLPAEVCAACIQAGCPCRGVGCGGPQCTLHRKPAPQPGPPAKVTPYRFGPDSPGLRPERPGEFRPAPRQ